MILWIVLLLGSNTTLFAQENPSATNFVLKGKITAQDAGMIKLSYADSEGKNVRDSASIQNGQFEFKGKVNGAAMAYLSGNVKTRSVSDDNIAMLFLEPGSLTLEVKADDFRNLRLKGSKTQDEYTALESPKKPYTDKIRILSIEYNAANTNYINARKAGKPEAEQEALKALSAAAREQMNPISSEIRKIEFEFIKSQLDSYYAAYLLKSKISSMPLEQSKAIYAKLSERVKQSSFGKEIANEIKSLAGGSPGSVASVFSATEIKGGTLSLADFKGKKYVLLDFWASWCVPCRKGNPHLLSLYSKYKDKGFEIIGVSDDDSNLDAWKNAVNQDKIGVWKHVLRGLKYENGVFDRTKDISANYAIHTLPTKILVDENGIIIGRYGGGGENDEAMDKKLAEIFQ
ncbi:MAG: AhpC/TSA family protein [Flavobacterium sp.]|nr:MAG: AhpC/TSA family protein [Flavobacterium sp.]